MANYNFDEIVPRRGTNCEKWDRAEDPEVLPMWVADMDFRIAPAITKVLRERVDHGVFGYTNVPKEYYEAVVNWFSRKHGWTIEPQSIIYTSGVIPALSAIIKAMTEPGDKVIFLTPVYNHFFSSVRNDGCEIVESHLVYHDNTYFIDYDDLEAKCADPKAKVFILCNPHNPAGRVWTKEELTRMGEICLRHNVFVLSDEIHCELVFNGNVYTPFASISEEFKQHSCSCVSPSKNFNIAGLQIANIVCANDTIRRKIDRAININEVCDVNPFGVLALQAAYNESEDWLNQLLDYLWQNYLALCDFFKRELPSYPVTKLEGTYLVWVDITASGMKSHEAYDRLLKEAKLMVNPGYIYGTNGDDFIRLNIACPRSTLLDGLNRLKKVL